MTRIDDARIATARIEVVVPAHNAAGTLEACLTAIQMAGFAPSDVVVADDGSRDATDEIACAAGVRIVQLAKPTGAAAARNSAAAACTAPLILFVDADVALHKGTRANILSFFADHPDHAGVIGSYDDAPPAEGTLSRVRNLLHHHVHQISAGDVPTFWTGCGAVRRSDFVAVGGFEPGHRLEDVALGMALARRGRAVRLEPSIQCTHLKRWTLRSMVKADLLYRALPWSRMLLDPRNTDIPAALNAGREGKLSVVFSGLIVLSILVVPFVPWVGASGLVISLTVLAVINRNFLKLVSRRLGIGAAVQAVGVLFVHFLCAGTGFALALVERRVSRA
jgi:GT2 family glycosyltransferase